MSPSLNEFLTTVVLVSFVVTVVLAVCSYGAYKLRERRRGPAAGAPESGPVFFTRYVPPRETPGDARPAA